MINFKEYFEKNRENIIKDIIDFIAIPSVLEENPECKEAPFGVSNVKALEFVLNLGKKMGFEVLNCDNVCGHIEYGEGDEVFGILCHSDVVPAIGDWDEDPFYGYVKDGKIFGRGSIDDKGPCIVSLYALKALKDMGIKVNKKIRLIVGTDEESGSRCVKRYFEKVGMPDLGISPDAEFPIIYGEKGILSLDIYGKNDDSDLVSASGGARYNIVAPTAKVKYNKNINEYMLNKYITKDGDEYLSTGKSAHAMEPNNGINAILNLCLGLSKVSSNKLVKFISECLDDSRLKTINLDYSTSDMGDLTMNIGLLNIDRSESRVGLNIRFPKGLDSKKLIEGLEKKANEYELCVEVKSLSEAHYIDPNCDFIKTLYSSYVKYTNADAPLKTIGGGTYARSMKKAVAYGVLFPLEVEMAHETNEYADIENLLKAGAIIADATYNICK